MQTTTGISTAAPYKNMQPAHRKKQTAVPTQSLPTPLTNAAPIVEQRPTITQVKPTTLQTQESRNQALYKAIYDGNLIDIQQTLQHGANLDATINGIPIFARLMDYSGEIIAHYIEKDIEIEKVFATILPHIRKQSDMYAKSEHYQSSPFLAGGNMADFLFAKKSEFSYLLDASTRKWTKQATSANGLTRSTPRNERLLENWEGLLRFYNHAMQQLNLPSTQNVFHTAHIATKLLHQTDSPARTEIIKLLTTLMDFKKNDLQMEVPERIAYAQKQGRANDIFLMGTAARMSDSSYMPGAIETGVDRVKLRYMNIHNPYKLLKTAFRDNSVPLHMGRGLNTHTVAPMITALQNQMQHLEVKIVPHRNKKGTYTITFAPKTAITRKEFRTFKLDLNAFIQLWKNETKTEADDYTKTNTIVMGTRQQSMAGGCQNLQTEFIAKSMKNWVKGLEFKYAKKLRK